MVYLEVTCRKEVALRPGHERRCGFLETRGGGQAKAQNLSVDSCIE